MNSAAMDFGGSIRQWLGRGATPDNLFNLELNTAPMIQNANALVEMTPALSAASHDLAREVSLWVDQAKQIGGDRGPAAEAQRNRAMQAAERYEALLTSAAPSQQATDLGL